MVIFYSKLYGQFRLCLLWSWLADFSLLMGKDIVWLCVIVYLLFSSFVIFHLLAVYIDYYCINISFFLLTFFWIDTGLKKPSNRSSAIAENLLNNSDCARNYSDSNFSIISKTRNDYYLRVLESLFIKTFKPNLCKQQYVYNSNLYKLL